MEEEMSMDQAFLKQLTEVVEANLEDEHFGVEALACSMGMSRYKIHRKLKSLTGQSVSQFIRVLRLKRAMELLQKNVATVSEIAYGVGFGSPTYFNKCFHDFYGFPPGEARKRGEGRMRPIDYIRREMKMLKGKKITLGRQITAYSRVGKIIVGALILMFLYLLFHFLYVVITSESINNKNEGDTIKSIAILPFKNLSDDPSNNYFVDGMMEDILNHLSGIGDLRVISRISAGRYRKSTKSMKKIARELGVNYVLEGSARKYGQRVRISVQLLDAPGDRYLWSETYDRELTDIFAIQSDISLKIAHLLKATLSPRSQILLEHSPTQNLTAYDYYLKGRLAYNQYLIRLNELDLDTAIHFFKQALKMDSKLAEASCALGAAYLQRHQMGGGQHWVDTALMLSRRAIGMNPNLWEAYYVQGLSLRASGDHNRSRISMLKAVDLNHSGADAFEILGFLALLEGRFDLVMVYRKQALELDPVSTRRLVNMGYGCMFIGDLKGAKEQFLKALELQPDCSSVYGLAGDLYLQWGNYPQSLYYYRKQMKCNPNNLWAIHHVALVLSWMGQYEEAEEYFRKIQKRVEEKDYEQSPLTPPFCHRLAYVLWMKGDLEGASSLFDESLKRCHKDIDIPLSIISKDYSHAAVHAMLGNNNKACELLDVAFKKPGTWIGYRFVEQDPLFKSLHNQKQFRQIIKEEKERLSVMRMNVDRLINKKGRGRLTR